MYTLTILTKRKPGVTREEFFEHYQDTHFRLASALPGLVSYQQASIEHGAHAWQQPEPHPDYDALSTYTFASYEEAHESFSSELGRIVDEDTGSFIDWPSVIFVPSTPLQRFESASPTVSEPTTPIDEADAVGTHLRLVWPQWQGAGTESVAALASEFPLEVARRAYATGAHVLAATLPPHAGPTVIAPVHMSDEGLEERDGMEAKTAVTGQLREALALIAETAPARITTLGGECSVSVAAFSALAHRYDNDLAIIWIDSHPDISTNASDYTGYHSMAVAALTGHGDPDVLHELPATVPPEHVALVGLHEWFDDDHTNIATWGLQSFSPDDLRTDTAPLRDWLARTGVTRAAIHFDVDAVDSNEVILGLGAVPNGLTSDQIRRIITDLSEDVDVVAFTVAEFIPRQVVRMRQILDGLPLVSV